MSRRGKLAVEIQTVRNGGLGTRESLVCHKVRSNEAASRLHEGNRTAITLGSVVFHHMRTSGMVIKPFCPPIFQSTEVLDGLTCIPSWKCVKGTNWRIGTDSCR